MTIKTLLLLLKLLPAIIHMESNNQTTAYNRPENALGILQIRPIMLREANRIQLLHDRTLQYTEADRTNPRACIEIFLLIMEHHKCRTILQVVRKWNGTGIQHKEYLKKLIKTLALLRKTGYSKETKRKDK